VIVHEFSFNIISKVPAWQWFS